MNKRGPVVTMGGLLLLAISIYFISEVAPASELNNSGVFMSEMFEDMFDSVTEVQAIPEGGIGYFSYDPSGRDVPLLWGIQILDYQNSDRYSMTINNIYGDSFGTFRGSEPLVFDTVDMKDSSSLNFVITNTGTRTMEIRMMFTEDPENSKKLNSPSSPLNEVLIPLALAGFGLVLGIIILFVGSILSVYDWKNQQKKRNF